MIVHVEVQQLSCSFCSVWCRMKHPSERLHDEVGRALHNEKEVIEGVASTLQRVVEQITEQIR